MDGAAVEQIAGLATRKPVELRGLLYRPNDWVVEDPAALVKAGPTAEALAVYSLGALRDYLVANRDELDIATLIVHVVSPQIVRLAGTLQDRARNRESFVNANALNLMDGFVGKFMAPDEFIIGLQTRFARSPDLLAALKLFGTIKHESVRTSADDGITQTVTAKAGVVLSNDVAVPNPVALIPFRTFREVDQPPSLFALRVNASGTGTLSVGLFEADGGAWRLVAVDAIRQWLAKELPKAVAVLA